MRQLIIKPEIYQYEKSKEFCIEFKVGKGDLLVTNKRIYDMYLRDYSEGANVIFRDDYGKGEPNDEMAEKMYAVIKDYSYDRVIAIGGGSIQDIGKLFALKEVSPVADLFEKKIHAIKEKVLIMVPTTCGTGSEVTNISILGIKRLNTKFGLADDALYADYAVLIPQLLECLPFNVFATSSIDAFIHAIESYLSPKATTYTKMYSREAMKIIIEGYKEIVIGGKEAIAPLLGNFLLASNYAGIAFGNAGCAAVHAMSYPLGDKYHIPHGESNYVIFKGVFDTFMEIAPYGAIKQLNEFLAEIFGCKKSEVYFELDRLMNNLIYKKRLKEYGVKKEDLIKFTESVMEKQSRLMSNSYVPLDREKVLAIYNDLY